MASSPLYNRVMFLPSLQSLCLNSIGTAGCDAKRQKKDGLPQLKRTNVTKDKTWEWKHTYGFTDGDGCTDMTVNVRDDCNGLISIKVTQAMQEDFNRKVEQQIVYLEMPTCPMYTRREGIGIVFEPLKIPNHRHELKTLTLSGTDGDTMWRKVQATCCRTMWKAIWCIVDSFKKMCVNIDEINYTDYAIIEYASKDDHTHNVNEIAKLIQKGNACEQDLKKNLGGLFYRIDYYQSIGFEFDEAESLEQTREDTINGIVQEMMEIDKRSPELERLVGIVLMKHIESFTREDTTFHANLIRVASLYEQKIKGSSCDRGM